VTVMHCAVTVAQTEDLRLAEAITGLRRHWRRGLVLGLLVTAAVALGAFAVPFYASAGRWGWPLAALSVYVLLVFFVVQLALWPLAVFEARRPLRELVREAGLSVLRRPFGFAGLGLALLLVNVVGVAAAILPFLSLTIAYSFLVSAHYALPKNPAREV
jgi:MFS family permease